MSLSPAFLDELRARTTLSTLIQKDLKLTKAGREFRACCPFHGEKTPSFYVNDDKGFYHCFGCSAHGDAIRWMTDQKGLPFMDAVKELAAAAGLEMPERDPQHAQRDAERQVMIEIMARAQVFYQEALFEDGGQGARAYLEKRGVDPVLWRAFGLGWASGGRFEGERLWEHLKDVAPERLIKLGLAKESTDAARAGEIFDFFRNRLTFPIRDPRGRVIGFGGRVIGTGEPKYLNSPDTPIFDKGNTLFNVDRAAAAARKADRLLVVEGYMDVIGLAGAGIHETVAPNGTALTEGQIQRLWRLHPAPILCFDGDSAGKKAAARAAIRALPLLEPDKSLNFITPPEGADPDDVARSGGAAAVEAMLAKPRPLVDVIWEHERTSGPIDTPEQRAGLAQRLRAHAGEIRNGPVRQAYLEEFKARYEALTARQPAPRRASTGRSTERQTFSRRPAPQTAASKAIAQGGMRANVERAVLAGLLRFPELAREEMEIVGLAKFSHPVAKALRDAIMDGAELSDEMVKASEYARSGPLKFSFTGHVEDPVRAKADLLLAFINLNR